VGLSRQQSAACGDRCRQPGKPVVLFRRNPWTGASARGSADARRDAYLGADCHDARPRRAVLVEANASQVRAGARSTRPDRFAILTRYAATASTQARSDIHRIVDDHFLPEMGVLLDEFLVDRMHLIGVLTGDVIKENQLGGAIAAVHHIALFG